MSPHESLHPQPTQAPAADVMGEPSPLSPVAELPISPKATPSADSLGDRPTLPEARPTAVGTEAVLRSFGPYQLRGELAHGGMGIVYKAHDPVLGRIVALKMLRAGALANAHELERFYREAKAAAQLRHPNIVPIYEFGQHDGRPYYTMTFIPGGSLARHTARFASDPWAAVALLEKVARAVHYAHQHGILHRDLKPANILLDEQGEPLVGDFGLARLPDANLELTQPGDVLGTPLYMAPEQAAGETEKIGPATDVWALGVILYELLTGQRPFMAKSREELSGLIRLAEPRRPRSVRPQLDRALETIVLKCLAKDPGRRYASAEALAEDLARWLAGEPILAKPEAWPRRLWRKVRRHPLTSVTGVLLGLAAVSVPLAIHHLDPDRPVEALQAQLAAGEPVTLIGETGPPPWSRWMFGQGVVLEDPLGDKTFYIQSHDPSFLELLPSPLPQRYIFRAEVRARLLDTHEVGIYFSHSKRVTRQGTDHCYCGLIFSRVRSASSDLALQPRRRREEDIVVKDDRYQASVNVARRFPVAADTDGTIWHSLQVTVTPEMIEAIWDHQLLGQVPRAELVKAAQRALADNPDLDPTAEFLPHGGLGLYVSQGAAAFRRVVVQPLR